MGIIITIITFLIWAWVAIAIGIALIWMFALIFGGSVNVMDRLKSLHAGEFAMAGLVAGIIYMVATGNEFATYLGAIVALMGPLAIIALALNEKKKSESA